MHLMHLELLLLPPRFDLIAIPLIADLAELKSDPARLDLIKFIFIDVEAGERVLIELIFLENGLLLGLFLLVALLELLFVALHELRSVALGLLVDCVCARGGCGVARLLKATLVQHACALDELGITYLRQARHFIIVVLCVLRLRFLLSELCEVGELYCGLFRFDSPSPCFFFGFLWRPSRLNLVEEICDFLGLAQFGGSRLLKALVFAQLRHFSLVVRHPTTS